MAQKYIENPLCVSRKKFDIRQWVLITSFEPGMGVWFYEDCYLRFGYHDYDPSSAGVSEGGDLYSHLTNNSIIKKNKTYGD